MSLVAAMCFALTARGQYAIWTNNLGGVRNWSVGANWHGGSAPAAGGGIGVGLLFTNAGTATTANNDLAGVFALTTLWFRAGAVTLSGNPILFTNNVAVMPVLTNSSGGPRTIENDLIIGTNLFIQGQSDGNGFRLTGGINLGGAVMRTITVGGGNSPTFATVVTNTGVMSNGGLLKAGEGLLVLAGANTYSYGTLVTNGTLQFDSPASIGGAGANVTNAGGAIGFNFADFQGAATTRIGRITAGSLGISAANSTEAVDFRAPLFSNAFLGAVGTVVYDHNNYTPHVAVANGYGSNQWRFGGGSGLLIVTSSIGGADSVLIGGRGPYGTVQLRGTNTFAGELRLQDFMHLLVTNAATAPAWGVGQASMVAVSNGTFSIGNAIVTNPIVITGSGASPLFNHALIRLVPGTTNLIEAPITAIMGFAVKVVMGSGAGQHIFSGGVIGTNAAVSFYDDVLPNPITLTNRPVLLGTNGILSGHNLIIAVQSNVAGRLNIDWGSGWRLDVANAFVGSPVINFGTAGSTAINWLDLNSNNVTVSVITMTNQIAANRYSHYITSTNPGSFTYLNPTGGFINTFFGRFTGAVSVTKGGASTLVLVGTNWHTGATTVEGGTLAVIGEGRVWNSAIAVNGGSLLLTNLDTLGVGATLTVNAGGAVGASYGLDQAFIDAAYVKMGAASPAYALGAYSASDISFDDPFRAALTNSFLGAAPLSNMVFSGSVAWGSDRVRLGGGGGWLRYVPVIGSGTNLYVGPVGGDSNSVVVLMSANAHDLSVLQSGHLAITNDAALGTVPGDLSNTNIVLTGGNLVAVQNSVRLAADRRIFVETSGGLGANTNLTLFVNNEVFGPGELAKVGAGTLVLHGGLYSYTGGTRIVAGTLNITNETLGATGGPLRFDGGVLQVSGTTTLRNREVTLLAGGGTIRVDTNQTLTITNSITGVGRLIKTGTGWLILRRAADYAGGTVIAGVDGVANNSRVYAFHSDALGGGPIVLTNGGQLFLTGGLSLTNPIVFHGGDASTAYNGALQSAGGVNVIGGPVVVSSALTRITVWNGSTIRITNGISGPSGVNFSAQNGSIVLENLPIVCSGSDIIYFSGGNNGLGTNYLNVAGNAFTNSRIWQGGLLVLGAENALPTNVSLLIGDTSFDTTGTLDLNGFNQGIGNLSSGTNNPFRSFITNRSATAATLTVNQTSNADYRGVIAGAVAFVKNGPGTMILALPNSHTGGTAVGGGALQITNEAALGASGGPLTLSGGASLLTMETMTLNNRAVTIGEGGATVNTLAGTSLVITNAVAGANRILQKSGGGALALGGATTLSNLWVNAGSVLNQGAMFVTGSMAGGGNGLQILNAAAMTNAGAISFPNGKLQLFGNGTLVNSGAITNGQVFVLSEGVGSSANHTVVRNLAGGSVVMAGGTFYVGLYYPGTFYNEGDVLQNGTVRIGPPTWATTIGSNTIGTLEIAGGLFNFTGGGSFQIGGNVGQPNGTGVVNLVGGVLALNKGITKGNNPDVYAFVNFDGGALSGTVNNVTLLGAELSKVTVKAGGGTVALAAGITNTIAAALQDGGGGGGMVKDGAGVLRLTAANLYAGVTRVRNGTLALAGSGSIGASTTIQIDAAGTLDVLGRPDQTLTLGAGQTLKGEGVVSGGLIVGNAATVSPGSSPGALTVTGNVDFQNGSVFEIEVLGTISTQYDRLLMDSSANLSLNSATLSVNAPNLLPMWTVFPIISGFGSGSGAFAGLPDDSTFAAGPNSLKINYNTTSVTLTVVPEPSSIGLLAVAGLAAFLRRRCRG